MEPVIREMYRRAAWVLAMCLLTLGLGAQEEKRLTVYTPQKSFTVDVQDHEGRDYVSLHEVLRPLVDAEWKRDGDKWRLRFAGEESQFQGGKNKAKIGGKNIDMGAPVVVTDEGAWVPVRGLAQILPRLLNSTVELREPARRLIIAGANTEFTADLQANPSRLVLHFSRPVNPTIASEPGRIHLTFTQDPVTAPAATQNFADKLVTSASFADRNGAAELIVAATAPLLATYSDDNRTITLAAAPQAPAQVQPKPAAPPAVTTGQAAATPAGPAAKPVTPPVAAAPPRPRFLVVIDPAHGGDDRGALLAAGVEEKELALAFARRLRAALERSGVAAILLRDGDSSVTVEQRAIAADTAHASVFISVHAGNLGRGVRLYTARVPDMAPKRGAMLPWDTAQASYLEESKTLSGSVAAELAKRGIQHAEASVQLEPLNHITGAALAVEFLPGKGGVASLADPLYQQNLCAAIADAIGAARSTLEARK